MTININQKSDRLLFILTLGALTALGPLAIDLYLPAIPTIASELNEPLSTIQFTLSAYTIGFALGQLIYGPMSDRFGRRKVLFPGLIAYIITNAMAAFCETGLQLIIVRVLQAMAGAAVMVTIPAMVRDLFPRKESARVMSSILMVMTVAPLAAPLLGGQILKFSGWESLFLSLAGLAGVAFLLASLRVPETLPQERKLIIPVHQVGKTYLSVLKNREVVGLILCHGFFFGGMFAFIAGSPFIYIELFGVKPENYGLLFGINILGMMITNMVNIRIINRFELFSIIRAGSLIAAASALTLLTVTQLEIGGLVGMMIPIICYVACISFTGPNSNALALSHFPKSAGTANAVAGALRFGIGALSTAAVGYFHNGTAMPMVGVMATCGVLSVCSLALIQNNGIPLDDPEEEATLSNEQPA